MAGYVTTWDDWRKKQLARCQLPDEPLKVVKQTGGILISKTGDGFMWLSDADAVTLRDWLNANVRD